MNGTRDTERRHHHLARLRGAIAGSCFVDALLSLFDEFGDRHCGEEVSQRQHALQAAELAYDESGGDAGFGIAGLLHDFAHLLLPHPESEAALSAPPHEALAADLLAPWFPPAIVRPIRLHVVAKRWLCGSDAGYRGSLSPASLRSLQRQGGAFAARDRQPIGADDPGLQRALALRRIDDRAKSLHPAKKNFDAWRPILHELVFAKPAAVIPFPG